MKTQSILKTALLAASFSTFALIGSAQAQILQVDFTDGASAPGFTAYGSNSLNNTATIGAYTVNLSGADALDAPGGGGTVSYANMYDSFAYSNENPAVPMTLTVAGLADSTTYDVTVWSYQGANSQFGGTITQFAPGGSTTGQTGTVSSYTVGGSPAAPTSNSDYSETLTEKTDATGLLTITATGQFNDQNGQPYGRFNGFEIDAAPPVEAPEPSTYALMGLGALALVVISRRRKA